MQSGSSKGVFGFKTALPTELNKIGFKFEVKFTLKLHQDNARAKHINFFANNPLKIEAERIRGRTSVLSFLEVTR